MGEFDVRSGPDESAGTQCFAGVEQYRAVMAGDQSGFAPAICHQLAWRVDCRHEYATTDERAIPGAVDKFNTSCFL